MYIFTVNQILRNRIMKCVVNKMHLKGDGIRSSLQLTMKRIAIYMGDLSSSHDARWSETFSIQAHAIQHERTENRNKSRSNDSGTYLHRDFIIMVIYLYVRFKRD